MTRMYSDIYVQRCSMNMTPLKSMLAAIVLSSVVVVILYGTLQMDRRGTYLSSRDVVLVYTNDDVCGKWSAAFPSHAVILVGDGIRREDACHYMNPQNGSLNHYILTRKFQPYQVYIVQGDQDPNTCSTDPGSTGYTAGSTGILYQNSKEPIYDTQRHWGYGGNHHHEESAKYFACNSLTAPGMRVTIPRYARHCHNVLPPMVLDEGVYTSTTGRCVVLARSTLWAMPLFDSTSSSIRESTALSLVAQKLMWASGDLVEQHIAYTSDPHATSETPSIASEIATHLNVLKCNESSGLDECLFMFVHNLTELNYVSERKFLEVREWAARLRYIFNAPQISVDDKDRLKSCIEQKSYTSPHHDTTEPVLDIVPSLGQSCVLDINRKARDDTVFQTCKKAATPSRPWLQWSNTLLIVVFNTPTYVSIPLYEALYRPFFPHIVYCGPSYPNMTEFSSLDSFAFTFVQFGTIPLGMNNGSTNYDCLVKASRLGYDVTGYLQVADDLLLMPHRLQHMDLNKVWTWRLDNMVRVNYNDLTICDDGGCRFDNETYWWAFNSSTLGALAEIRELAAESQVARECHMNIERLYGGQDWSLRILSDFFYIPTRFIEEVTELFEVFHRNHAYLEIAVPTILHCIIPQHEIEPIYTHFHNSFAPNETIVYSPKISEPHRPDLVMMAHRVYEGGRDYPWNHTTGRLMNGISFYHPHKLSHISRHSKPHIKFFCNLVRFYNDPSANTSAFTPVHAEGKEVKHQKNRIQKSASEKKITKKDVVKPVQKLSKKPSVSVSTTTTTTTTTTTKPTTTTTATTTTMAPKVS